MTVYYPRLLQNVQGLKSTGNHSQVKIVKGSSELSLGTLLYHTTLSHYVIFIVSYGICIVYCSV